MNASTILNEIQQQFEATSEQHRWLQPLYQDMLQASYSADSLPDLLTRLSALIESGQTPLAVYYFERTTSGDLTLAAAGRQPTDSALHQRLEEQLTSLAQAACEAGGLRMRQQAHPARAMLAIPVLVPDRPMDAIGFAFGEADCSPQLILITQLFSTQLALWHTHRLGGTHQRDANDAAAVVDLMDQLASASDLQHACFTLATELADHLQCQRVAVGLRPQARGRCRLMALSGVARFDKRSTTAQAIESAMSEALLRDDVTVWPPRYPDERHAALAHKQLASLDEIQSVLSLPLRDADRNAVGALVVTYDQAGSISQDERFLQAAEQPVASCLQAAMRIEGGPMTRLCRVLGKHWRTWKFRAALVGFALVLAAMWMPLEYQVRCDCQIEPVTRRYVAAPFDGLLAEALVEPGDLVRAGDVLATLDGRELRWELASVEADQKQAIKRRDAAQVAHKYSEQQIAQLEIERLELELQLLRRRTRNLEIKSPVDGIVVSGDLERAEGAPLSVGETLFEIAPLEEMIVEVAVPESEITRVAADSQVTLRLDAYPGQTWDAVIDHIQPRATIREEQNVFVGEARLDNSDQLLRPGMKGRAKVQSERRPLGWILFHKPWEYATKKLGW